jgi:cyanophycinase-like exopeptidase
MDRSDVRPARLIAIFGSGETSSAMTSVHQDLIARAGVPEPDAILLDTPFGFQENADEIAARAVMYFRERVGCEIRVASFRHRERATPLQVEQFLGRLGQANYVFAGPGSPTYALRHWRADGVRGRLLEKVTEGGCLALASAAAIGLGAMALPVYEIYKVGEDPSWVEGLDLLGQIGVHCAVIPHYNNHEGGTHDTRFCYMGEPRLRLLESMLPDNVLILGIDEYTACIIDIDAESVTVRGRGGVTVRRRGVEQVWRRTTFPLRELQIVAGAPAPATVVGPGSERPDASPPRARTPLRRGDDALGRPGVDEVVTAILQRENALEAWVAQVAGSVERQRVQAEMRHMVVGLGERIHNGGRGDARQQVAPLVDVLLSLRGAARRERRFEDADRLRAILAQCGVEVQDTASGTAWSLAHS